MKSKDENSLCFFVDKYIALRYIGGEVMDAHIKKVYVPMTETGFYILLCLQEEMHGYSIIQKVEALTDGDIRLSPGTMYCSRQRWKKMV